MSEQAAGSAGNQARRNRFVIVLVAAAVLIIAASAAVVVAVCGHHRDSFAGQRPSGIPASIPDGTINLMGLAPVPARPAPAFTLTDQDGRTVPLSGLRGKVVVLEFMDPHCTDICPLISQEFVDAYHDLGRSAPDVVFAAVNVNQYFNRVPDVLAYSRAHQLINIPGWHFLTGPAAALQAVWRAYHVEVQAPSPDADIVHTSAVYFIGPSADFSWLLARCRPRPTATALVPGCRRTRPAGTGSPGTEAVGGAGAGNPVRSDENLSRTVLGTRQHR